MVIYPRLAIDKVRELFLANGFTVKPGNEDLKGYVYDAARSLEREVHKVAQETDAALLQQALEALLDGPDPNTGAFTPEYAAAIAALEERLAPAVQVMCWCGDIFSGADVIDPAGKCRVCGEGEFRQEAATA
jgi:hypothetical protein